MKTRREFMRDTLVLCWLALLPKLPSAEELLTPANFDTITLTLDEFPQLRPGYYYNFPGFFPKLDTFGISL